MATPLPASTGTTGEFRLDVEAAEEAVRTLEGVRRRIKDARAEAVTLAKTLPTARDAVSLEAFALLAEKADGGPGSFTAAMDAGLIEVENAIDQMRADITRQRQLDDDAASDAADRA